MSLFKKNALTLGIGALVIGLTIIVFFSLSYSNSKTYIDNLGLYVALSAEVVSVIAFMIFNKASMNSSRVMVSAGAYTTIVIYFLASLALAVVFTVYLKNATNALLTLEAFLLALLLIILIIICSYGGRLSKTDDVTTEQMTAMGTLESNVRLMCDNPLNSRYSRPLNGIYEAIRNSDQSVYTKTDEIVSSRIYDLNILLQAPDTPREKIMELSEHIMQLINQRTMEVRQSKKGGI
jgi:hypothetical protein